MHAILELREVLLSVAERHIDVAMPSQTFLQHAQPTSFGHWFGMWSVVLERDTARMRAVFERINESPAGAGILTGSDFAVDRYRTAELLGFSRPLANTWTRSSAMTPVWKRSVPSRRSGPAWPGSRTISSTGRRPR